MARRQPTRSLLTTRGTSGLLFSLVIAGAVAHVILAPRHALLPRTTRKIRHAEGRDPHSAPEPSQAVTLNATDADLAAQQALLTADLIHSNAAFQAHLHSKEHPLFSCQCPASNAADAFSALRQSAHEFTDPLPAPMRLSIPGVSIADARIWGVFSDVYVVNLPGRADRQHYMCTILSQLQIPALFWPAFPRRHTIVRTYANTVKHAHFNPLLKYRWLQPPPPPLAPLPPLPAGIHAPRNYQRVPGPHFRTSEVACYLSHREIWLDIVNRRLDRPVLMLEDDVEMEENFVEAMSNALQALPPDWAVFWIGSCFEEMRTHDAKIGHRLYVAQNPSCTHGYALRNHTVAAALLRELGHDVADSVDIVMARILEVKRAELPSYVMLPPPLAQLYRTAKRKRQSETVVSNPSDVNAHAMKLPVQHIMRPVRHAVMRAEQRAHPELAEAELLCGNALFTLETPEDVPGEIMHWADAEYLP